VAVAVEVAEQLEAFCAAASGFPRQRLCATSKNLADVRGLKKTHCYHLYRVLTMIMVKRSALLWDKKDFVKSIMCRARQRRPTSRDFKVLFAEDVKTRKIHKF
jgi:hypothetical protein